MKLRNVRGYTYGWAHHQLFLDFKTYSDLLYYAWHKEISNCLHSRRKVDKFSKGVS